MKVKFTEEQQAVIDARNCNVLVSAAAGSGKTAVLVERIIQMISSDADIDHLLVVTFTKAAASQMKEKITLAIQDRLLNDPDNKHLQKQETLIHNAQITTIDSFCQYVLKNNFNNIGIDPSFHVGDDGELRLLQEEVMSELLEEEYTAADGDSESDFLYCMEYFSNGSSDKPVEEYIKSLYRFAMSMPWPEDWLRERASDYEIEEQDFEALPFVVSCKEYAKRRIAEMLDKLIAAEKICCESDGPYMYGDTLEADQASVEALLRYDTYDALFDGLRVTSFGRLPVKKDDSVSPDKREYVQKLRKEVKDAVAELSEDYFALPSGTVVEQMKLCDRAVKELCRLAIRYKELFDAKKRDRQMIDFSDMEHFALQILVEHPSEEECRGLSSQEIIDRCRPSAVALEYRDFYKEVLIDEYQDSNNVQELILKAISGETPNPSERFMVGDVKQSIYKFRLARPEIFMDKLATYDKAAGTADHRIDLHKNFRSRKEVLEVTNYIFEKIMGKDLGSVEYDEDARLVPGAAFDEPAMEIAPELIMFEAGSSDIEALAEYDARQKEALVIAERIHKLMEENRNLRYKDMVILLRSLSGWDEVFKQVLESQGIPAYVESKSGYFDAPEVAVMLDLMTIVDNPSQDIPLITVMHSYLGGFSDEDMARLRILTDENPFYPGLKGLAERYLADSGSFADSADDELLKKLAEFVDFIEELRNRSVYTPVHELLQYIIDRTGFDLYILSEPAGNQRKANLDMLMAKALSYEKTSFKGLFHFVRYIEHMKVAQVDYGEAGIIDENADVIRIMSIHKSKGLEFPIVFVSGLTKGFNRMDTMGNVVTDMDLGLGVKCIDLEHRVKYDTLKRIIIADKMKTDSLGEELRVLYVALTRAKEKLILTAAVKKLSDEIMSVVRKMPVLAASDLLLPYSVREDAGSYFDLVLASLIRHRAFGEALDKLGLSRLEYDEYKDKSDVFNPALKFIVKTDDEIASDMLKRDVLGAARREKLIESLGNIDGDLSKRLLAKFESPYAYENLKGLFTKTTVTELKKHKLEEIGEVFTATSNEPRTTDLTGAERGTAYHRIMEILDEQIYGDEAFMNEVFADSGSTTVTDEAEQGRQLDPASKRLYAWLIQQIEKGMIPEEYKSCVWTPDIKDFLKTELGQRMGRAYRSGNLFRERPFMMGISASELDPKFPQEEMVLIQGIIDAWFIENDEIVLLDYKTDQVKEDEELVKRYRIQLDLYKRALELVTKKRVKEVLIYSFKLAKSISL